MSSFDLLRPPTLLDASAAAYKDWYHLNLFDHRRGRIGLINVSLHGDPTAPQARSVGTALVHVPGSGWVGNVETRGLADARITLSGVLLEHVALAVDPLEDRLVASVDLPEDGYRARISAKPAASPIRVEFPTPFGSGWIAWFVLPQLELDGVQHLLDEDGDLAGVTGYHDHNWGRWFWGEDLGWEWGVFAAAPPGPVFVVSRLTDRAHHRREPPRLLVSMGRAQRSFPPGSVSMELEGRLEQRLRRLPGALAALYQDRSRPPLPARIVLRARAGLDWVRLEFAADAAAQLIEGDPMRPGYAFINEIAGAFRAEGRVRDVDVGSAGLGVVEYVE